MRIKYKVAGEMSAPNKRQLAIHANKVRRGENYVRGLGLQPEI